MRLWHERGYRACVFSQSVRPCGLTALRPVSDDASVVQVWRDFVLHRTAGLTNCEQRAYITDLVVHSTMNSGRSPESSPWPPIRARSARRVPEDQNPSHTGQGCASGRKRKHANHLRSIPRSAADERRRGASPREPGRQGRGSCAIRVAGLQLAFFSEWLEGSHFDVC